MPPRRPVVLLSALLLASAGLAKLPGFVAAVADANRPADDKARDAARKPAEMLAFAQVKRGQTVADFMPGKGYFTRLFSNAVGARGHVYAITPQLLLDAVPKDKLPPSITGEPGRGNVIDAVASRTDLGVPPGWLDLVWTAQNYHDVYIWAGADGTAALDKAVYTALKPGGAFVVLDHSGVKGQDDATTASSTASTRIWSSARWSPQASCWRRKATCCATRPTRGRSRCSIPRSGGGRTNSCCASASRRRVEPKPPRSM